ncbi:MAG: hypothetical protein JNL52_03085 [Flavobacteriales bacterium]|nr:hypothetical protein [Flavobacteriales bacterium]
MKTMSNDFAGKSSDTGADPNDIAAKSNDIGAEFNDIDPKSNDIGAEFNVIGGKSNDIGAEINDIAAKSNDIGTKSNDFAGKSNDIGTEFNDIGGKSNVMDATFNDFTGALAALNARTGRGAHLDGEECPAEGTVVSDADECMAIEGAEGPVPAPLEGADGFKAAPKPVVVRAWISLISVLFFWRRRRMDDAARERLRIRKALYEAGNFDALFTVEYIPEAEWSRLTGESYWVMPHVHHLLMHISLVREIRVCPSPTAITVLLAFARRLLGIMDELAPGRVEVTRALSQRLDLELWESRGPPRSFTPRFVH